MIKKLLLGVGALGLALGIALVPSPSAGAFELFNVCKDRPEAADSTTCVTKSSSSADPISGDDGILNKIADLVAFVAGAIAVVIILVGSIRMVTSNGDANSVATSRRIIIGALVGLLIIVFARLIIYFVLTKLAT